MRYGIWSQLLFSVSVGGQTIYLGTPGTGFCAVTGATNTTPIQVTVASLSACGINANGQSILVTEVGGNTAANIHLNNSADSAAGLRRIVAGINAGANKFTLLDGSGLGLAGNGTYTSGGRVSLATAATLKSGPIGYFDGTGGSILTSIADTSSTGRAFASRPAMQALEALVPTWGSNWGDDRSGAKALGFALHWKATGSTTSKAKALSLLTAVDQVLPTTACREGNDRQCGSPASSHADYPSQNMVHWSLAFTLMRADMSPGDVTHFVNWALNDLPWTLGGQDYTASSFTKPAWKVFRTHGTVSASGTAVTGSGTSFVSDGVVAGDIIIVGVDVYSEGYQIASVNSETSLTLVQNTSFNGGSAYQIGPRWTSSHMGLSWHQKHFDYAVLCGGAYLTLERVDSSSYLRICENYPTTGFSNEAITPPGGRSGYNTTGHQNLALSRLEGMAHLGLVTCPVDPRGCLLAEQAYETVKNVALPRGLNIWSGFTQSTSGYQTGRLMNIPISIDVAFRNSTNEAVSMLTGTNMVKNLVRWGYAAAIKPLGIFVSVVESAVYPITISMYRGPLTAMFHSPSLTENGYLRNHIYNELGYTSSQLQYNSGEYVWSVFLFDDPSIAQIAAPTTMHFTSTDQASCVSRYGSALCPTDDYATSSVSRQDLTAAGTYLFSNIAAWRCLDHCIEPYNSPGWSFMQKNGRVLRGNDHGSYYATRPRRDYVEFGGTVTTRKSYGAAGAASIYWAAGDNTYSVLNTDLSAAWKTSANVTTDAEQTIHMKSGGQDFVLHHVRAVASAATQIRQRQLFPLNGCGTVTSTSCVSFSSSTQTLTSTFASPNARLLQKILPLGGLAIKTQTETGTDSNGSYTGGAGLAFAIEVCPSSDGGATCNTSTTTAEWVTVMEPTTNTSDTLPPIVQSSMGNFRVVEIQHSTSPAVAVFTAAGATGSSGSFTTTHAGTALYVLSGLSVGTYTFTRNGSTIASGVSVATGVNTASFSSSSGTIAFSRTDAGGGHKKCRNPAALGPTSFSSFPSSAGSGTNPSRSQ